MDPKRRPRGYVGIDHETLGSTFQSILAALKQPEQVLDHDELERLKEVDAERWYPVGWLLSITETLDGVVGQRGLVRIGRRPPTQ